MATSLSRLVIAGLSGDSGKTIVSLSFLTALKRKGHSVSVFKKGPDYIDPAWLSIAAQSKCRNLDTYMVDRDVVLKSFVAHAERSGISVVEGNRGLFDGRDVDGTHSTAELAKLLAAPVVLVVGIAKTTRTVAALIKGCLEFDRDLNVAGVILNRSGGRRHATIVRGAIEKECGVPVIGVIPRLGDDSTLIPGRHLGLVTPSEFENESDLRSRLEDIAQRYIDVDRMIDIAETAGPVPGDTHEPPRTVPVANVKIGYFRDSVFTFYYPENLEALERNGAELIPVSSLADDHLPDLDALYIGGGFPETHAEQLADNRSMMESVRGEITKGLPVYAECGGLIYLARSLAMDNRVYEMSGVFSLDLTMHPKPVGHGYTMVRVDSPNPFFPVDTVIRGHEFHYTGPVRDCADHPSCMAMETGVGVGGKRDGLIHNNTLACYTHLHADGVEIWAPSMISRAASYAAQRKRGSSGKGGTSHSVNSLAL